MSEPADYALCEKFEANMFAKNRCQNCLRTITAHQHGNQVIWQVIMSPPPSDVVLRGQKVFLILYLDGTQLGIPLAVG
uniref:Uncharacterized protein n=1 Tax=Pseudonaja textilis TaxID=8673 RepID=A0A670XNK6_PSETE